MKFRTEISPLPAAGTITHSTPVFLIGSCFTDNIGRRMSMELFDVMINPFGALYNPASIASLIDRIADMHPFDESELISDGRLIHSFMAHSTMSRPTAKETVNILNDRLRQANAFLRQAHVCFITLGTAYVYTHKDTGRIVANCHKLPADCFIRSRLTSEEAASYIRDIIARLNRINPELQTIFTVSPIRHTADGLHANQLSKATLLLAIDSVAAADTTIGYFPAFEILMDDLRDYRFYAADMKHPSDTAADYAYSLFAQSYYSPTTISLADKARRLTRRLDHRQLSADDASFQKFQNETNRLARELLDCHPQLMRAMSKYIDQ